MKSRHHVHRAQFFDFLCHISLFEAYFLGTLLLPPSSLALPEPFLRGVEAQPPEETLELVTPGPRRPVVTPALPLAPALAVAVPVAVIFRPACPTSDFFPAVDFGPTPAEQTAVKRESV